MSLYNSFLKVGVILLVLYSIVMRFKRTLDKERKKNKTQEQNEKA